MQSAMYRASPCSVQSNNIARQEGADIFENGSQVSSRLPINVLNDTDKTSPATACRQPSPTSRSPQATALLAPLSTATQQIPMPKSPQQMRRLLLPLTTALIMVAATRVLSGLLLALLHLLPA